MKPDKPGEWHSRDGRKLVVYEHTDGEMAYREIRQYPPLDGGWNRVSSIEGDDWLPAVAPVFQELPPKPLAVFAKIKNRLYPARWFAQGVDGYFLSPCGYRYTADRLCVAPHPDNDADAVRMIQEAKA